MEKTLSSQTTTASFFRRRCRCRRRRCCCYFLVEIGKEKEKRHTHRQTQTRTKVGTFRVCRMSWCWKSFPPKKSESDCFIYYYNILAGLNLALYFPRLCAVCVRLLNKHRHEGLVFICFVGKNNQFDKCRCRNEIFCLVRDFHFLPFAVYSGCGSELM